VHAVVKQTKERSGWPAKKTLAALGIPRGSYYRWLKEEAWAREQKETPRPVQPFEALEEERQAVLKYAREHAAVRHRELAWKMIDDDAAYLSPSTVYRILREANLMCRQRGRQKRHREEEEKAKRPDEIWGTDLMYVKVNGVNYYYLAFIDEYSRYIVHRGHYLWAFYRAVILLTHNNGKYRLGSLMKSCNMQRRTACRICFSPRT
jgi:putative transposase